MRRSWLKEVVNVSKRYLIAAAAHNLGRILRKLFGVGKPRTLQDLAGFAALVQLLVGHYLMLVTRCGPTTSHDWSCAAHVATAQAIAKKRLTFPDWLVATPERSDNVTEYNDQG